MNDLGTLGGLNSHAAAINQTGIVCGWGQDPAGAVRPVVWQEGAATALPSLGGRIGAAWGLNDAGVVVGNSETVEGEYHAALWSGGAVRDLGTMGGSYSVAYDVNNAGIVGGTAQDGSGREHACLWDGDGVMDLGSLSGGTWSAVRAVNDGSQVILWGTPEGAAGNHAAFWDGLAQSPVIDLGTFGGTESWAFGMNDHGSVVGWAGKANGTYEAFVWDGTAIAALGTLGGLYSAAYGINEEGVIVGFAHDVAGVTHAVQWVPVPEPAPSLLLLGGVLGLWLGRQSARRPARPLW